MSDQNKQIIEKANELVSDGNYEDFLKLCTDDVKWTILSQGTPMMMNGRGAIGDFMTPKSSESSAPPQFTIDKLIADADTVVSTGEMSMKEKDGTSGQYKFCDIYTLKDGKIAEFLTHINRTGAKSAAAEAV